MFDYQNDGIAALESGGALPYQDVQNTCPASSAGNVERQSISEAAGLCVPESGARLGSGGASHEGEITESEQSTSEDASCGHNLCTDPVSNDEPSATFTGDQIANAWDGGSMINVLADASLPNNYMSHQSAVQAPSQMPLPFFSDPFQYELEKISRELETAEKTCGEEISQLKFECERKIAEIVAQLRCDYDNATVGLIQQSSRFRPESSAIPPCSSVTSMAPLPTPSVVSYSNSAVHFCSTSAHHCLLLKQRSQLKAECERKIAEIVAQVHREYDSKLHNIDSKFHSKKKELEANKSCIIMSRCLADTFETKCLELNGPAALATPIGKETFFNLV